MLISIEKFTDCHLVWLNKSKSDCVAFVVFEVLVSPRSARNRDPENVTRKSKKMIENRVMSSRIIRPQILAY